jgi:predicted nucleotidyltransferase
MPSSSSSSCKIISERLKGFLKEFSLVPYKEFNISHSRVLVYGFASCGIWRYGSDVDIVVFSEKSVSLTKKGRIYDVNRSLSKEYGLVLEQASASHPPLVFKDNLLKRILG